MVGFEEEEKSTQKEGHFDRPTATNAWKFSPPNVEESDCRITLDTKAPAHDLISPVVNLLTADYKAQHFKTSDDLRTGVGRSRYPMLPCFSNKPKRHGHP